MFTRLQLLFVPPIAFVLALAASTGIGAAQSMVSAPSIELSGGQWFDGGKFVRTTWYSVDGKFTKKRPKKVNMRIDLAGRHVIPPFAEAHNHDLQNSYTASISAQRYLRDGIFYSAQLCGDPQSSGSFRRLLSQPNTVDVLFADACITASDGHPFGIAIAMDKAAGYDARIEDYRDKGAWAVDSIADLDARWPKILAAQPKLIKIILVYSEDQVGGRGPSERFGFNGLNPSLVPHIVERAHAAGIRVVAHVNSAKDFEIAVAAGADIIAHMPALQGLYGKKSEDILIPEATAEEAARRGIVMVPTAVLSRRSSAKYPELASVMRDTQIENLRRLLKHGVRLATGSDMVMTGSVLDEIEYLDELNIMPRAKLLYIATMETPRVLFPERNIGSFSEGAEASLIVLDGDPLKDLKAIRSVWLRIKQGNIIVPAAEPAKPSK